jgi:hypothetical protein
MMPPLGQRNKRYAGSSPPSVQDPLNLCQCKLVPTVTCAGTVKGPGSR